MESHKAGLPLAEFHRVKPEDKKIAQESQRLYALMQNLRKEVEFLKGQSTFKINLSKMEKQISQKFPELKTCKLRRSLPDKIKMQVALRTPLAWLPSPKQSTPQFIDEEGISFPTAGERQNEFPQLVLSSSVALADALSFLKKWSLSSPTVSKQGTDTPTLDKVILSDSGELTLLLVKPHQTGQEMEVLWGTFDSKTFAEKFQRLQDVLQDLEVKGLSASQINLHSVPERKVSLLGDTEIVGRVFVRLK